MNLSKGFNINPITSFAVFPCIVAATLAGLRGGIYVPIAFVALGLLISLSLKMAMVDSLHPGSAAVAFSLAGPNVFKPEVVQPEPPQQQAAA